MTYVWFSKGHPDDRVGAGWRAEQKWLRKWTSRKINFISPHLKILLLVSHSFFFIFQKVVDMTLDPYIIPDLKIDSKWMKDLDVRTKTIKLLEENRGKVS